MNSSSSGGSSTSISDYGKYAIKRMHCALPLPLLPPYECTQIEYLLETIYIIVGCWMSVSDRLCMEKWKIQNEIYAQLLHVQHDDTKEETKLCCQPSGPAPFKPLSGCYARYLQFLHSFQYFSINDPKRKIKIVCTLYAYKYLLFFIMSKSTTITN